MALTKISSGLLADDAISTASLADGIIQAAHLHSSHGITTSNIAEGSNEYHTTARARAAVSVGGSLAYNSSTGVVSFTQRTDGTIRGLVSVTDSGGDGSLAYNNSTGVITYTGPSASEVRAHISVTDSGGDGSLAYSNGVITYTGPSAAEVRAHLSAGTGVTYSGGAISIGQSVATSATPTFGNITLGTIASGNITTTGYLRGPSSFTIDPATHGDDTGTVVIAGNLQVDGTTTTINSTTVAIDDLNFSIATDAADSAAADGAGITIGGASAIFAWDHAQGSMTLNKELSLDNNKGLFFQNSSSNGTLGLKADTSDNITFRQNGQWDKLVIKNTGVDVSGNIVVTGTVDGVDIAARDAILTSTTTTAGAALPKAGGTMSGALNMGSQNISAINNATAVSFLSTNGYWVGGTQRMNGSGNLLNIGTINTTGNLTIDSAGSAAVTLDRASTSTGSTIDFKTAGTLKWYMGLRGLTNDNWYLRDEVGSTNALTVTSGGNLSVAGAIGAGDGTASLPSLSFAGDTNTGLFLGNADQLNFAIGGQDKAFFSATQLNVSAKVVATELDINGNADVSGTLGVTGAATFAEDVAINNGSPELYFGTTGNHYNWRIAAQENTDAAFQIDVGSQDTEYGNDSYNSLFTVKNTGKVGIGNTNPAGILHVDEGAADDARIIAETHAGGDSMILFSQGASGAGSPTWGIGLDAGSGTSDGLSIGFEDTGYDDFSLTSDSKLVITTTGYVGIGTTNPAHTFHADAGGNGTGIIGAFEGSNPGENNIWIGAAGSANNSMIIGYNYAGGAGSANNYGYLVNYGDSPGTGITIADAGKVGIGTTTPDFNLDIEGSGTPTLAVRNSSSSSNSQIHIGEINTTAYGVDIRYEGNLGNVFFDNHYAHSTRPHMYFRMQTAGTPINALTINPIGNVGIGGDTAPESWLSMIAPHWNTGTEDSASIRFRNSSTTADTVFQSFLDGNVVPVLIGMNCYVASGGSFSAFNTSYPSSYIYTGQDGKLIFGTTSSGTPSTKMNINPATASSTGSAVLTMGTDADIQYTHYANFDYTYANAASGELTPAYKLDVKNASWGSHNVTWDPGAYSNGNFYVGTGKKASTTDSYVEFKVALAKAETLYCRHYGANSADGTTRTVNIDYSFDGKTYTQAATSTFGAGGFDQNTTIDFDSGSSPHVGRSVFSGHVYVRFELKGGSSSHETLIGWRNFNFKAVAADMTLVNNGGGGTNAVESGMWTLTNASTLTSNNGGFISLSAHNRAGYINPEIFELVNSGNYGVSIKKPGKVFVSLCQDIITIGSSGYGSSRIYRSPSNHANNQVMSYSLFTNTNSQWDMMHNQATFDVQAGDIVQFYTTATSLSSLDSGSWSQYSIMWFESTHSGQAGQINSYLPNAHEGF